MQVKNNRKNGRIHFFLVFLSILLAFATLCPVEQKAAAISPYDSGYNHGCDDGHSGGHNYLDSSGGSSAHTGAFMQGYNAGFNACGGSQTNTNASASAGVASISPFSPNSLADRRH